MNTEILGVILQWVALVVLCYPLGRYIAKVYRGERTWLDFMAPVERAIYRFCGIDPEDAIAGTCEKFIRRFGAMEQAAADAGRSLSELTRDELLALWALQKQAEHSKA